MTSQLQNTKTATIAVILTLIASTSLAITNDRLYLMGDTPLVGPSEGASNGATVGSGNTFGDFGTGATLDSVGLTGSGQLPPLTPQGNTRPVYTTISGRPDGGSGLGIQFNGVQQQFLNGRNLNLPANSFSALGGNVEGLINYNGISNRGLQFWVQPGAGASGAQSVVLDSNQHGVRITDGGKFSLRYADADYDTDVDATPGSWYHVMVVRPLGPDNGGRMYVNGNYVVGGPGGYNGTGDSSDLVVGANTGGTDGFAIDNSSYTSSEFTGGTSEFFTGIVDDLSLFVIGDNSGDAGPPAGQDWGDFDFATDNAYAAFTLSGVAGDVDNNGVFQQADVDDFISGWQSDSSSNGVRAGGLNTLADGDLNFDGITDIFDLNIMQAALRDNGLSPITAAQLTGNTNVPEPSTVAILLVAGIGLACCTRRSIR